MKLPLSDLQKARLVYLARKPIVKKKVATPLTNRTKSAKRLAKRRKRIGH